MMMNRVVGVICIILCFSVLAGIILEVDHPDYGYDSDVSIAEDGFSYSVSSFAPAEFNIVVTDNGGKSPIEYLYIYYDDRYGSTFPDYLSVVEQMESRFFDRGFKSIRLNTSGLADILATDGHGTGIVMGTGTMPSGYADPMLKWVRNGGTVYWTYDVIGKYIGHDDGTYSIADRSMEADFLGIECTSMERASAVDKETVTGYSQALGIRNREMLGALDRSLLTVPYLAIGYQSDDLSEIVSVQCGEGTVCVISGDHDAYQISDIVQCVCSGINEVSVLISHVTEHTDAARSVSGKISSEVSDGDVYIAYSYVTGLNPPYGKTVRFVL